ncbi:MAG: S41 family peptidase [Anaerolineae bacterium]
MSAVRGVAIGIALVVAFLAGFAFRDGLTSVAPGPVLADPPEHYPLLVEVQRLLETHYLRELPDQRELEYAAIRGMIGSLNDPYTFFVDPPVAQSESDVLAGQYGGIGVQVQHAADGHFVLYPFPNGPAAQAGIEDGDILLAIDDWVVEPAARIDVVDQALRGEVGNGNGVVLRVLKRDTGEERRYEIAFAVIEVPSVVWRPLVEDSRIGYVQVLRFTSRTPEELRAALRELSAQEVAAWILDVRNNAGGLLQEAIEVADEFLDEGVIVYERTREDERTYSARPGGAATELPLVVLVNRGTASAAELVAGALQDNGRGIVIGQSTYGKGSVQLIFPLSDGSSVHITSAEWFTPNRTQLERNGLTPDVPMIPAEDGRDVELGEAVHRLRQQL